MFLLFQNTLQLWGRIFLNCFLGFCVANFRYLVNLFLGNRNIPSQKFPFFWRVIRQKKLMNKIFMPNKFATNCLQHKKRVQKKKIFKSPNLILATSAIISYYWWYRHINTLLKCGEIYGWSPLEQHKIIEKKYIPYHSEEEELNQNLFFGENLTK
jgi:hypothetical protein